MIFTSSFLKAALSSWDFSLLAGTLVPLSSSFLFSRMEGHLFKSKSERVLRSLCMWREVTSLWLYQCSHFPSASGSKQQRGIVSSHQIFPRVPAIVLAGVQHEVVLLVSVENLMCLVHLVPDHLLG